MGRKKSKLVLAIVIVIVISLILLAGLAYYYLATDLLKSNKQLFFEYVGQIGNAENGLVENTLKDYFEKKEKTPYTNEGEFFLNIDAEDSQNYENINNFNISFSGQVDKLNNKVEQDIKLNYSEEVYFPLSYKQIGNILGLQTKYVSSKHLAIDTENLGNLTENSTINFEETTKKIESLTQISFTEEELQHIQETYMNVLNTQLKEEQFTKIEEINHNGYQLKLTGLDIKNILKQSLETLKNDQITLNKINLYLEEQGDSVITSEMIEEFISDMESDNDEDFNQETFIITAYSQNDKINKITFETNEFKVELAKINENDLLKYVISLTNLEESTTISVTASYTGLNVNENINENYEVVLKGMPEQEAIEYKYQLNNNIKFINEIEVEEFSEENAMMLTDYDTETVTNFIGTVGERIEQVNKKQMEELGLSENENPLFQMLLPISGEYMINKDDISNIDINALEITTFNEKFEVYEGTSLKGTTVKGLLTTIARNNGINSDDSLLNENVSNHLIKEINFNGEEYEVNEQNINFIKNEMKLEGYYRVEFEMDEETGAIYRTVINEKVGQ